MQMGGMVWHDVALNPDDKNTENSIPNGKYDAGLEEGIEKVIEELGFVILMKEIEIESQQEEIAKLRRKIESIELYLDTYENYLNKQ